MCCRHCGLPFIGESTKIETLISQECKFEGYSQKNINSYLYLYQRISFIKKTPRDYLIWKKMYHYFMMNNEG